MDNTPTNQYPEERRLVTVLFADLQGFTVLADRLDFEVVSDLMQNVWLKLDRVIGEYGGYIDKHMGDAFMVVWGAPQAREDDAEKATAAGLAILEALEVYKRETHRPEAEQLELRVGIHSGLALAGYVGLRGEYTVLGDTVNVAKRIEEEAEVGTVVISETTYQFVQGAFRMQQLGPLKLRGKKEPILAYVVSEALERPTKLRYRSVGGLETNLVGRERQLEKLKEIYHRAQWAEHPLLAIVTGPTGIGKSRLMMEFVNRLAVEEPRLNLISSRALQQASKVPFYLWRALWANLFDLKEDDPLEITQRKFVDGIQSLWGQRLGHVSVVETAHFIGDMLGFEWAESRYLAPVRQQPEQRLERAFALHGELLSRAGAKGPLVLMLDDLQWADHGSMKLLSYLIQYKNLPMFILAGCRSEAFQNYHQLRDMGEIISLRPLPVDPELVRKAYPALNTAPLKVLSQLAQRSEGNPFYLEELVKNLVRHGESDYLAASGSDQLPQSLQLLLQARLDALTPEARGVALLAAVVGRVFWRGAVLAALVEASGTTTILNVATVNMLEVVQSAFLELTRAELAFPRAGGTFAGEREYIFKHSLLRDVAYSLLPHKYRGQCHLAVAQWLAKRASPELSIMVAEHYEKAGAWEKARHYYIQAAEYARVQGNLEEAQSLEQHLNSSMNKT